MPDRYLSFQDLFAAERVNVDYKIDASDRGSPVLIMAPHGGGIEPATSAIAAEIAGSEYSLFLFDGVRKRGNGRLHIRSGHYDLPQALEMTARAEWLVTIHGCAGEEQLTLVGGLDVPLSRSIASRLASAGFAVATGPHGGLGGLRACNICNRSRKGTGVQLEITQGQRRQFFRAGGQWVRKDSNGAFRLFCESVRAAIAHATSAGPALRAQ